MRLKHQGLKNEVFLRVLRQNPTSKNPQKMGETFQRESFNSNLSPQKENLRYTSRKGFLLCLDIANPLLSGVCPSQKLGHGAILSQNPKAPLITLFQTPKKNNPFFLKETFKRGREILNPKQPMLSLLNNRGLA
ncbi:hypothetical protein [Helicobacter cetorum]|uniref:hypothetical protein n=1 Tax=Helicobacter cetorum TaxID=138563 RepID=UPI000CF04315|nr:hypothetical protein [Helicobacter cetorum]